MAMNCPGSDRNHYIDVIMTTVASQITSLTIVYLTVYSFADQRKHQSSASLAFVRGIHRGPVNSQHKWPVTRKTFPFDDVIMICWPSLSHDGSSILNTVGRPMHWNRPISQIPHLTYSTMHHFVNSNMHICSHFCNNIVHCGIWDWYIEGFVEQEYYMQYI